jgi:type IV secretory pathway TraG/TraD family ATPase VirD4
MAPFSQEVEPPANPGRFSAALGDHEVERVRESESSGGRGSGSSRQTVHEREAVVTAGEIARLPKLTGYISIPGEFPLARFKAKYRDYPNRVPPIANPPAGRPRR